MLEYKNDDDKCYGATGMAISLVVLDGDSLLSAIDVDSEHRNIMELSEDYYFCGNPGLSARHAWGAILKNFDFTASMAIGNLLCRSLVLDRCQLSAERKSYLHDKVVEEAAESCSLDEDEAEALFNKRYTYFVRVFSHQGVQSLVHDFAANLRRRRRLTHSEVLEGLRALTML